MIRRLDSAQEQITTRHNPHSDAVLIGVTPDHRLLTSSETRFRNYLQTDYYLTNLDRPDEPERKLALLRPQDRPYETALSPDGTRIAACVHYITVVPGPPWFKTAAERLGVKPQRLAAIWVCRMDGTDGHEIGYIPTKANDPYSLTRDENPHALQWTPDGKHLSYVYHHLLYTVGAD